MKKGKIQLLLLCSFIGLSIFFPSNVTAAETSTYRMGNLPVQGSIGKIENELPPPLTEPGNELLDIRVLIPKELTGTLPQTGTAVPNHLKKLGIVLIVVGLSYLVKHKRVKGKGMSWIFN